MQNQFVPLRLSRLFFATKARRRGLIVLIYYSFLLELIKSSLD